MQARVSITCLGSLGVVKTKGIVLFYFHNAAGAKTSTATVAITDVFTDEFCCEIYATSLPKIDFMSIGLGGINKDAVIRTVQV